MQAKKQTGWDRVVTVLSILLAVAFFGSGLFKLVSFADAAAQFARFGYASWFVVVAIITEVLAAVLLLMKKTRYWGASLIIITMIAAMLSHLKVDEPQEMISPLVIFILATIVAWSGPFPDGEPEPSEPAEQHEERTEPLVLTLLKQLGGSVVCVIGIYIGIICVFGNEPIFLQYPLLRWGGMALGFGAAFGGMTLFNGPHKEAESAGRSGQLRTR